MSTYHYTHVSCIRHNIIQFRSNCHPHVYTMRWAFFCVGINQNRKITTSQIEGGLTRTSAKESEPEPPEPPPSLQDILEVGTDLGSDLDLNPPDWIEGHWFCKSFPGKWAHLATRHHVDPSLVDLLVRLPKAVLVDAGNNIEYELDPVEHSLGLRQNMI